MLRIDIQHALVQVVCIWRTPLNTVSFIGINDMPGLSQRALPEWNEIVAVLQDFVCQPILRRIKIPCKTVDVYLNIAVERSGADRLAVNQPIISEIKVSY